MPSDVFTRSSAELVTAPSVGSLRERHKLGLLALERTRLPMVVTDPRQTDNPIVLANAAFLEMTGYSGDEILGRNCRFLQGPETDPATVEEIRSAIIDRRELEVEILNYHRDGRPFWNQLLISPVFDEDGTLCFYFASQIDVSARRAAEDLEAAEHLLLKEVDHRAKNALALVQSIMRLTATDDAAAYAHAVQGRVDALARAHALLAERRWRGVEIDRLILGEIEPYGHRRVRATGPAVQVGPAQVQPIALLLHEMLENAASHGALLHKEGRVTINWSLNGDDDLLVHWQETSESGVLIEREPALGLRMVTTMVERQLHGQSSFDWRPSGLEVQFRIPMQRAASASHQPHRGTSVAVGD